MQIEAQLPHQKWLKAAVIGSSWAAFEIIVGSFLHNLRVPFAGMILSAASVFLLVAYLQLWNERGIIIRAGLICALMKSISPSALIFGPMIGITMEALIIEGVTLILGRNIFGFLLAGGLAVLWSLFQKVLNLFVLYGFNLLHIVESFYGYLQKLSGLHGFSLTELVMLIGLGYVLLGMGAAALGRSMGKSYLKNPPSGLEKVELMQNEGFLSGEKSEGYNPLNLFVILIGLTSILILLNKQMFFIAIPVGMLFVIFVLFGYRSALRRLTKPAVWLQFLLITLVAAFLWDWVASGESFSLKGLWIGLEMNLRALLVIFAFAAISVELRNPVIKAVLYRHGFSQLYKASGLAFSALPALITHLPQPRTFYKGRRTVVFQILERSELLLEQFTTSAQQPLIVILKGEIHQGKTTFLIRLTELMQKENIKLAGIISVGAFEGGQRSGYTLKFLPDGKEVPLAASTQKENWQSFRRFWFNPQALNLGNQFLIQAGNDPEQWIIIDEVGPMELEGGGWSPAMAYLVGISHPKQLWVVRNTIAEEVIEIYNLNQPIVININDLSPSQAMEMISPNAKF
jgi:nucleoside-triphosphatase THEP1